MRIVLRCVEQVTHIRESHEMLARVVGGRGGMSTNFRSLALN
jgi:hypothetical protein